MRPDVHPFRAAIEAGDDDAALATLSPGIVFRSPAVYKPYEGRDAVAALLRIVALVWHAMLVVVILQSRHAVARRIRARPGAHGMIATFRNRLAATWHLIAIFYAVAIWFVWAFEITNGVSRLIRDWELHPGARMSWPSRPGSSARTAPTTVATTMRNAHADSQPNSVNATPSRP